MKIMYCITRSNWDDAQANVYGLIEDQITNNNQVILVVGETGELTRRVEKLDNVEIIYLSEQKFSEKWSEFPQRLRIIPGLTGYAQIHGGYDLKPNEKYKLDNYYIEHYSLWQDCKIAFETFKIIFTGDGAR